MKSILISISMNENFCPAPWVSLFYHANSAAVCCANKVKVDNVSPTDFANSEFVKSLKQEFLEGKQPQSCSHCWQSESLNLQSIRQHYLRRYSESAVNLNTVKHLELRASNLCNFKCRMCNSSDSILIKRETDDHAIIDEIDDYNWEEIKILCKNLRMLILTGGEPTIIKRYYELIDYLIEEGLHRTIGLIVFTNCSVYNSKFFERITQFKRYTVNLSLDAVGKIAEYQRHGTVWSTVETNIMKLVEILGNNCGIHTTLTAYNILGIDDLATFLLKIHLTNTNLNYKIHSTTSPAALNFNNLPQICREEAINKIQSAIDKLTDPVFEVYVKELLNVKNKLTTSNTQTMSFAQYTKKFDLMRNESFEDVFGYKIY